MSEKLNAHNDLSSMLHLFIPGLLFMVFFSHLEAIQQSFLDFKGVVAGWLIRQAVFFILIFVHLIIKKPLMLNLLAIYLSISVLCGTIAMYFYTRKYLAHKFKPTKKWLKQIFGYGGYIFGSGMVSNIFSNVDQVMSAAFISSSAVAYYNAASRINGFVDIPSYAAAEIIFPKASKAATEEGGERVKYLYEKMVGILLCFTMPAAIFVIIFPKLIVGIIAGSKYAAAAPILQLYMITGLMRPWQNQSANLLNSIGKPAFCFIINTISLIINLIITYFCLKYFGFYGAAIATLIACSVCFAIWYFVMKKQIGATLSGVIKSMKNSYKTFFDNARNIFK